MLTAKWEQILEKARKISMKIVYIVWWTRNWNKWFGYKEMILGSL